MYHIIEKLKSKIHQADIIRYISENGYTGTKTNAQIYIRKLCEECNIPASKYRSGGNSLGTKRTGSKKSMDADYITRAGIFNHIWMGIELTNNHKEYIWNKNTILYELTTCVKEFRKIFTEKNIPLLYLFIEKYQVSTIKEVASFAKGLQKDIEAVENAVASEKSNGFVEGTNSRLKMIKRTMYGRCSRQIDKALAQSPADFAAFLSLMEGAGYEVKDSRGGSISFRAEGQERFTRLRASTLGEGYGPEDIKARLAGGGRSAQRPAPPPKKVNLIIDIQARMQAGKGAGYERWAKVYNLKQMAAALQYLQEHGLLSYDELEAKAATASERFHALSEQMQQLESDMKTNAALKAAIVDYAKARPVFEQYKASKYSHKFLAEHEGEIALYRAATAQFDSLLNGGKLPKMEKLKTEWHELTAKKKAAYKEYRAARSTMQEVLTVKANIDALLGDTRQEKNKEQER